MGQVDRAMQVTSVKSKKAPDAALAAAKRAVENVGSVGTTRIRVENTANGAMRVALKPTVVGAFHGSGYFVVRATADGEGSTVKVQFTDPVVTRPTILGFIPAGPRSVAGLKAYERCASAIRTAV